MRTVAILALSAGLIGSAFGQAPEYNGERQSHRAAATTDQVIVRWRDARSATARIEKLSSASGVGLQRKGRITGNIDVLKLERGLDAAELAEVLAQLSADPNVEYAVADQRVTRMHRPATHCSPNSGTYKASKRQPRAPRRRGTSPSAALRRSSPCSIPAFASSIPTWGWQRPAVSC
jgi:hypothetical protein